MTLFVLIDMFVSDLLVSSHRAFRSAVLGSTSGMDSVTKSVRDSFLRLHGLLSGMREIGMFVLSCL